MQVKLIYIGSNFYMESGTMLSCIYTEDGQRSDWGHVESILRHGGSVEIRQATPAEILPYQRQLTEIVLEREQRRRAAPNGGEHHGS
jgi:hypothetical protein